MRTVAHLKNYYLGLTETFIYGQISNLTRYRPVVYTYEAQNLEAFPVESLFIPQGPRWQRGWSKAWRKVLGSADPRPWQTAVLARRCREDKVDLLHAHFLEDATNFAFLAEKTGLPLIVSCYGYDVTSFPKRAGVFEKIERVFNRAARVIVLSNDMKTDTVRLGCPEEKIVVLAQGVSLPANVATVSRENGAVKFLCAASFVEKKGHRYLIEAFAEVTAKNPQTELALVGDGPLRDQVEELIISKGLSGKVTLLGHMPHGRLLDLLADYSIFVHPSVTAADGDKEGIPTIILESMARGVPVISTHHAGIPEVIQDGKNGLLVEERDTAALAEAMLRLANSADESARLAAAGRETARSNCDVVRQVKKLEAIYAEACSETVIRKAGNE